ncbi:transmembrane amino acid transporter protein-domain-containing protein [Mycena rebaudengoi]|nr:transmembrane amino acid transporter protein-domain-containing protein [Mycena rebaudengoi]
MTANDEKLDTANNSATVDEKSEEHTSSIRSTSTYPPSVPFEAYLYFAAHQRIDEANEGTTPHGGRFNNWLYRLSDHKGANVNIDVSAHRQSHREVTLSEKETASRALRLASWSSVFYLITTDILGPFNAPFAISQVGWVPGSLLYFFMGLIALYTGLLLWRLFIRLDSLRYPVRTYADIVERIFGLWARRVCIILQSVQLVMFVGLICLSNAQSLSQIAKHNLCFAVCIVIWALVGMVIGQIRTLKVRGFSRSILLNLLIIFTSMGFVAHSPPNFASAASSLGVMEGPIQTQNFSHNSLFSQVNGIMNMFCGAMIFPEMMAEMRRPMDFWKGMILAQALIFSAYLVYGTFVYSQQGQFTLPLAYQGVSRYAWQTVGNVFALITGTLTSYMNSFNIMEIGIIAAGLYGNIGIKVVYHSIVEDWYKGPSLLSSRGRYIWSGLVCTYWALAFIIGSAIPQVQTINGLVAALGIMQFSYTFPPLLRLGYDVISDAMAADEPYDPTRNISRRADDWTQWSRWRRARILSGRWYFKLFNLILFLAGTAMAGLGAWAAIKSIQQIFSISGAATSFGCRAPV